MLEQLMRALDFDVASVTVAKKKDFVPLQAADFLAHCGSTNDPWIDKLVGEGGMR
jgi:hypothetical protein